MPACELVRVLKQDALGRVELVRLADGREAVLRRATGGRIPGSGLVARLLLARERRALLALEGLAGVARVLAAERACLLRSFVPGTPLCLACALPRDYFERLEELVRALHERGVCHNDLHKEQNVLVQEDGRPAVLDFQLASVHRGAGRTFAGRAREDLRHVEKHRRRYTRFGRGPDGAAEPSRGAGAELSRSWIALAWRRSGKPVYNAITRGVLRTRDGEPRRPSSGPWPAWTAPVGDAGDAAAPTGCPRGTPGASSARGRGGARRGATGPTDP